MVTLSRIYTRTGDHGQTRLGDHRAVAKWDARVEAYGEVDELNSVLGLVVLQSLPDGLLDLLCGIQQELFDLGADLCLPEEEPSTGEVPAGGEEDASTGEVPAGGAASPPLRVQAAQVRRLEEAIDRLNNGLEPLRSFVLPGGSPAAAHLHLARAVCRRAERRAWHLAAEEAVNEHALHYLNRLSDLLFVLARTCNDRGKADVLWQPGKTRCPAP